MAKCFITGVEIPIHEAYVLDVTEARRAIRDLSNRIKAIEKLVVNLGERDIVSVESIDGGSASSRWEFRLVSGTVAKAMSEACPGKEIFATLGELRERRKSRTRGVAPSPVPATRKQTLASPSTLDGNRGNHEQGA